jgi:hypothetical protein
MSRPVDQALGALDRPSSRASFTGADDWASRLADAARNGERPARAAPHPAVEQLGHNKSRRLLGRLQRSDTTLPRISAFYGITIWMYWSEGQHARPHFHARYAGRAASVDFDGRVIAGTLPRRALAMVAEWAQLHRAELEANWASARDGGPLEPIEPLR